MLGKRPGDAAIAAFTLAFGIGTNVAMFTMVDAVLLNPLPYVDEDRMVTVSRIVASLLFGVGP